MIKRTTSRFGGWFWAGLNAPVLLLSVSLCEAAKPPRDAWRFMPLPFVIGQTFYEEGKKLFSSDARLWKAFFRHFTGGGREPNPYTIELRSLEAPLSADLYFPTTPFETFLYVPLIRHAQQDPQSPLYAKPLNALLACDRKAIGAELNRRTPVRDLALTVAVLGKAVVPGLNPGYAFCLSEKDICDKGAMLYGYALAYEKRNKDLSFLPSDPKAAFFCGNPGLVDCYVRSSSFAKSCWILGQSFREKGVLFSLQAIPTLFFYRQKGSPG